MNVKGSVDFYRADQNEACRFNLYRQLLFVLNIFYCVNQKN